MAPDQSITLAPVQFQSKILYTHPPFHVGIALSSTWVRSM